MRINHHPNQSDLVARFIHYMLDRPVIGVCILSLLIVCGLEVWRPYYFFTDDNLNLYPVMVESARNVWAGKNPYTSQYLYEGKFYLLHEISILHYAHPLMILLAVCFVYTPLIFAVVDI